MGRNANAGLVVGVLTGSGTMKHLVEHGAHVVLPDISYLKEYLVDGTKENKPFDLTMNLDKSAIHRIIRA